MSVVHTAPGALTNASAAPAAKAVRMFGRYQLLRLLGKSERTMVWLAMDTRIQQEAMLAIPRVQPNAEGAQAWLQVVRRAGRLNHPCLATPIEIGEQDRWPYVAYERGPWVTWSERMGRDGLAAQDLARWSAQVAQGLAFAHEAGVAHHDLQPWHLLVDDTDKACLIGLEVAHPVQAEGAGDVWRQARDAGANDVLALGLVMYQGLVAQPALEEPDVGRVIRRMPPIGHEFVRLPWAVPRPVPDPLRAIVNRATDRQERHRYRNPRTLQRALEGWLKTVGDQDSGPLSLLLDRLRSVGVLPAQPGGADRVAHLALLERSRTSELAEIIIDDLALTFELLRLVNGAQVSSDGPVLMLRRAVAMVGLEGVRRAALSLRQWPGPMDEAAATEMAALLRRVKRAGRIAVRLAPAGYDPEVLLLVTALQNLGRLVVQYHFPDEMAQIRKLMQPQEPIAAGAPSEPGMTAEAASFAVLGANLEELGLAVARHWGLDEGVVQMARRLPLGSPVHTPEGDGEILRTTACCANELVDALGLSPKRMQAALHLVVQRYARPLGLTGRDMQDALQAEAQNSPAAAAPAAGARLRA